MKTVLGEFTQDLFKCKIIVAHNITFDKRMVEVEFVEKFQRVISLADLRENESLKELGVLQKGSRLSILPVSEEHFNIIEEMSRP